MGKYIIFIAILCGIAISGKVSPPPKPSPSVSSPLFPPSPLPPPPPPTSSGSFVYANKYIGSTAPGWSKGGALAVASNGDIVASGSFNTGGIKCSNTVTASQDDMYLCKTSSSGSGIVAILINSTMSSTYPRPTGATFDSADNHYELGNFDGNLVFNSSTSLSSPTYWSGYLSKRTSSLALTFVHKYSCNGGFITRDLKYLSGYLYVTGAYTGSGCSINGASLPNAGSQTGLIMKLNTNGVLQDYATGYQIIESIDEDSSGNLYVSYGNGANSGVAKLNSALSWSSSSSTSYIGGTGPNSNMLAVAVDENGYVYGTGRCQTPGGSMKFGTGPTISCVSGFDSYTAVFDSSLNSGCLVGLSSTDGTGRTLTRRTSDGTIWESGVMKPGANFGSSYISTSVMTYYIAKVNSTCGFSNIVTGAGSAGVGLPIKTAAAPNGNIVLLADLQGSGNVLFPGTSSLSGNQFAIATYAP